MMKCLTLSACVAALLLVASPTHAMSLGLTQSFPDMSALNVQMSYNAGTGSFSVIGQPTELNPGSLTITSNPGDYMINAQISPAGVLSPGGTLFIGGNIVGPPAAADPLLEGNLIAFGFPEGPGLDGNVHLYEFIFEVSGGSLASQYGGIGAKGGVILGGNTAFDLGNAFPNSFTDVPARSDNFRLPVPEPATAGTFLMAAAGAIGWRRRRA